MARITSESRECKNTKNLFCPRTSYPSSRREWHVGDSAARCALGGMVVRTIYPPPFRWPSGQRNLQQATREGLNIPSAAAGVPANKKALLRNAALLLASNLSPASVRTEGLDIPCAAAGIPANKKALLRNAALLLASNLSPASVRRFSANNKGDAFLHRLFVCGERGIRTPGPVKVNGFQDRRDRPLRHLSGGKSTTFSAPDNPRPKKFFTPLHLRKYLTFALCILHLQFYRN